MGFRTFLVMGNEVSRQEMAGNGRKWIFAYFSSWPSRWPGRQWSKKVDRGYLVGNGFSRSTRHSPTTLYLCFCLCSYHSLIFIIHSPPDELDCDFSYRFMFHKEINEIRMISSLFVWLPLYFIITLIIVTISVSTKRKSIINHQYETTVRISEIYV